MVVAAAKITLDFWGNEEPRDKKKLLEVLAQDLLKKFNLSLNEVDSFNDLERCVIGLAFCSYDRSKAKARMQEILNFIDQKAAARVVAEDTDFIDFL